MIGLCAQLSDFLRSGSQRSHGIELPRRFSSNRWVNHLWWSMLRSRVLLRHTSDE
jgi:hypothetical protein